MLPSMMILVNFANLTCSFQVVGAVVACVLPVVEEVAWHHEAAEAELQGQEGGLLVLEELGKVTEQLVQAVAVLVVLLLVAVLVVARNLADLVGLAGPVEDLHNWVAHLVLGGLLLEVQQEGLRKLAVHLVLEKLHQGVLVEGLQIGVGLEAVVVVARPCLDLVGVPFLVLEVGVQVVQEEEARPLQHQGVLVGQAEGVVCHHCLLQLVVVLVVPFLVLEGVAPFLQVQGKAACPVVLGVAACHVDLEAACHVDRGVAFHVDLGVAYHVDLGVVACLVDQGVVAYQVGLEVLALLLLLADRDCSQTA